MAPQSSSDNDKKYQEILDKYAEQIKSQDQVPTKLPDLPNKVSEPKTETTPKASAPPNPVVKPAPLSPILNKPSSFPKPSLPPIPSNFSKPSLPPIPSQPPLVLNKTQNIPTSPNQTESTTPPKNNLSSFFKYLFFVSVLIFFSIVITLVYDYFKLRTLNSTKTTESIPLTEDTVSEVKEKSCMVNDNSYKVGETFDAADGCNQCECGPEFAILCSQEECL
ncbi:hypothetical protein KKE45_01605 [Patescibacteria group bacterium]|nr:hypothetical protein [Patescibacteria group bacterium]